MSDTENISEMSSEEALDELACQLAMNYLDTSMSSADLQTPASRRGRAEQTFVPNSGVFNRTTNDTNDAPGTLPTYSRNVLLLGAGASMGAFGRQAFPDADAARKRIDECLGERPEAITRRIEAEKERLQLAYGYKEAAKDFETHLAILSSIYSPGEVAKILADLYGERYWPHLTFELIAHMLKHRFIDVVINFNFDELLDQAVQEELGRSQYYHVISDGDCKNIADIMIKLRLKVPVHIKPHGTARHRSSLRFTKEHYSTLPDNMREFVEKIIAGYHEGEKPPYRTNVISVGFGMGSLDLIQMLRFVTADRERRGLPNDLRIYHINKGSFRETVRSLKPIISVDKHILINVDDFKGLHGTLRELVKRVGDQFQKPYRPRGTARHEFVHALFVDEEKEARVPSRVKGSSDAVYFKARLTAELVLSLAKGRGRVDLATLVDDRVGIYFDQWRRESKEHVSLEDVTRLFVKHPLHREGLDHSIIYAAYPDDPMDGGLGAWLWKGLCEALGVIDDDLAARVSALESTTAGFLAPAALLREIVNSDTRDINADFNHRHLLLSNEPHLDEVLHTNLGYSLKFADMVTSDWQVLLAVSEYGRVLERCAELVDASELGKRRFCLILADSGKTDGTRARVEKFVSLIGGQADTVRVYWLPFELHNHHMVITLKRPDEIDPYPKWDYTHAIRYDRRGLSNRINPVYLKNRDRADLDTLVETFFGYVAKAIHSAPPPTTTGLDQHLIDAARHRDAALAVKGVKGVLEDYWWKVYAP